MKLSGSSQQLRLFWYKTSDVAPIGDTSKTVELKNIQPQEFVNGQVVGGVETRLLHSLEWLV